MRLRKDKINTALVNGRRIGPMTVRDLYNSFCEQVVWLSSDVEVEVAPFETRFSGPGGMYVALSPYRDLFMVSVGTSATCEVRVSDEHAWYRALDLALNHFLLCSASL